MALDRLAEQDHAEVEDHRVKGGPLEVQIRAQAAFAGELVPLRACDRYERSEQVDGGPISFERGPGRIAQRLGMFAEQARDALAERLERVDVASRQRKVRERRGGKRDDVLVDGIAQLELRREVVLDKTWRDARGARDRTHRARLEAVPREALERGIADASVTRQVAVDARCSCHTTASYPIQPHVFQYGRMVIARSVPAVPSARQICVIGAGMSGLAAIRGLLRAGHEVIAYEAGSEIGGMWRYCNDSGLSAAYASLTTNTSRKRMQYPSLPMPESAGEFPHRSQMLAYLDAYAAQNALRAHIVCGARVSAAQPLDGGWEVVLDGHEIRRFDTVVIAGGHYWDAHVPQLPGAFDGTMTHARDYRTPEAFAGRRVVVVGGGQSALDIVAEVSTTADKAILACSHVHQLIPRRAFGRPFDDFDRAAALLLPLPLHQTAMHALMKLARAAPDRGELPAANHRLLESRWPVVVSPALELALRTRSFESRPHLSELAGERVRFADGSEESVDTIVFATGYTINFPFLAGDVGRGRGWQFPLYRRILAPEDPTLAFIGVLEPGPGLFAIVERQAQWLGEVLAGRLQVPARDLMWQAIDAGGERRSRRQFADTGPHTILCNRHAYLRLLARDLRRGAAR